MCKIDRTRLNNSHPEKSFEYLLDQMYKLYVWPHLDYGDILYHQYDPNFSSSLTNVLESAQCSAALAVTRAWRGTNTDKIYEELCRYQFDWLPSPLGTPTLLRQNVCPALGLLHNRKCPGVGPLNDDVPGAGHLHQLAYKHESLLTQSSGLKK